MKWLPVVIWVMVVLGAVVSGCDGTPRHDSRLTAVDSLLRDCPDSALAMVQAVCRDSLNEADRAYRDLLLTQARYRCYVTATSDSDINRALAWFSAHPSDREKLTRAYIYKGAVMEELGHPDSAMHYYKTTEATADPTDYFNLGYSNLRIGKLYQDIFLNDSAVVSRMRNAASFFNAVRDTNYLITTIGTLGLFDNIVGKDSAIHYLEKAIKLGKDANSSKQYYFQSKLAGLYFYEKEYQRSKDLSLDIIANGKEECEENKFYYYAARSYIKLNLLDSALWVKSLIPDPLDAVDSMNHHLLLSELAQATNDYRGYAYHSHQAHMIDERITESSLESTLPVTELHFDVLQRENKLIKDNHLNTILLVVGFILLVLAIVFSAGLVLKRMNRSYEKQLEAIQNELNGLIDETEFKYRMRQAELEEHKRILDKKEKELEMSNKRCHELENEQKSISTQVSDIARYRQAALNELHQNIRIKSVTQDGRKRQLTLSKVFKDLYEKRAILLTKPKKTFWNNLRKSIDGEFNGLASFVEQNYPNLSENDMQLFLLLCAGFPNQVIKLCMGYTNDVTVSKNKRRLMKERLGLDVKPEEFIQLFLQGRLG